ncbi:RING-H2 finger protein ATL74-like [Oryza brachyantha]|uniref:RING-H2 finger protein ATL74-like n=1 Tax=Oryza brachyantha TaxID=4533 RepID=UPI001ADB62F3|nr:RING-H2 finger protein ATL74-like [Oryza brachyantha]
MEVSRMANCSNVSSPEQQPPPPSTAPQLDYDVVVILAAMLCALVCALGLNSMLQCVVRCTRRAVADPVGWVEHRRASAGLKREDVVALPVATYVASPAPAPAAGAGCAICLSDFADGERVRLLPACGHRFHVVCIDRWLVAHCSCPTCRRRPSPEADATAVGRGHHHLQVLTAA